MWGLACVWMLPIETMWRLLWLSFSSQKFYVDGARIEAAFRKYVHRAPASQEKDSYEVFVCHGNVIRYFVCRWVWIIRESIQSYSQKNLFINLYRVSCSLRKQSNKTSYLASSVRVPVASGCSHGCSIPQDATGWPVSYQQFVLNVV